MRIVHAFPWLGHGPPTELGDPWVSAHVENVLDTAAASARTEAPTVVVSTAVVLGPDVAVLLMEAEHADLLVIGHRGLGALTGLLSGAVGLQLAGRTACPLLVVRSAGHPRGPVVVGVESPTERDDLLEVAFAQARRDDLPLVVVHAWHLPTPDLPGAAVHDHDLLVDAASEVLQNSVDAMRERFPEVQVTASTRPGRADAVLSAAAAHACMLIVGSRGASGLRGLVLGSVALSATQDAPCPVLVVPAPHAVNDDAGVAADSRRQLSDGHLR